MNTIREIERLNKLELENVVPPSASWHTDYRSTAYIHISGLPFTLSEGDILTIFSQFGSPTYLNLARDKDSGKSRGFAWLKYEDQRSTDLAVDNLNGATVVRRVLKVDHAYYKERDDVDEEEKARRELRDEGVNGGGGDGEGSEEVDGEVEMGREMLKEEGELRKLIKEHDDDDPMKGYLVEQKKEEVARAVRKLERSKEKEGRKHRHHHRRHHRMREGSEDGRVKIEDGGRRENGHVKQERSVSGGVRIDDRDRRERDRRRSGRGRSRSESDDSRRRERPRHRRRSRSRSP